MLARGVEPIGRPQPTFHRAERGELSSINLTNPVPTLLILYKKHNVERRGYGGTFRFPQKIE